MIDYCTTHNCKKLIREITTYHYEPWEFYCPHCEVEREAKIRARKEWLATPEGKAWEAEERRINKLYRLIQYWEPVITNEIWKAEVGAIVPKYTYEEQERYWFNIFKEKGYI